MTLNGIKRRYFAHLLIGLASFVTTGCATIESNKTVDVQSEGEDVSQFDHVTTIAAVEQIENTLNQAKQEDLPFLAPQHFSMADNALKQAKQLLAENASRDQIVQKVAVAEAVIRSGKKVKQSMETILGDALTLKQNLETYNAPKTYGREYDTLVSRLETIIKQIENGKPESTAEGHTALVKDLRELEVRSIIQAVLGEPKETLKRVEYRNGEELAPFTYQDAKKVVEKAEAFIYANPHDTNAIERIEQEALFATKRALYIAEEVAALSHKVNVSLEQVVLDEEYRLFRVGRILSDADFRNNPLEIQSEMLASAAKTLMEKDTHNEQLTAALKQTIDQIKKTTQQLSSMTESVNALEQEKNTWLATQAQLNAKVHTLQAQLQTQPLPGNKAASLPSAQRANPTAKAFTADNQQEDVAVSQIMPVSQTVTKQADLPNTTLDVNTNNHSGAPIPAKHNEAPSDNATPEVQPSQNHGETKKRDQIVLIPAQDVIKELNTVNLLKTIQENIPTRLIIEAEVAQQEPDQLLSKPSFTEEASENKANTSSDDIDAFMDPEW